MDGSSRSTTLAGTALDERRNLFYYTRPNVSDIDIFIQMVEASGVAAKTNGPATNAPCARPKYRVCIRIYLIASANCHFVNENLHFSPHHLSRIKQTHVNI